MDHTVFVYGQVRTGFWRDFILKRSRCLGTGRTQERYAMYVDTFPHVTREGRESTVEGEVFVVDDGVLGNLDRLKGHPDWYRREQVSVEVGGEVVIAWMYFGTGRRGKLIRSGNYLEAQETVRSDGHGHE